MCKSVNKTAGAAILMAFAMYALQFDAHAQRTMRYQSFLTCNITTPYASNPDVGGHINYGQYTLDGYWVTGVYSIGRRQSQTEYTRIQTQTLRAYGQYMHRLVSDRKRIASLYAGAGAFIGYEFYDPFDKLPEHIDKNTEDNVFIYGVTGSMVLEIFILKKLALTLSANMPLTFGSESSWLRGNSSIGLRFNL